VYAKSDGIHKKEKPSQSSRASNGFTGLLPEAESDVF
jgi:hypothetical protein